MDIGQSKMPALIFVCQSLVIHTEQMQESRLKIMNVNRVLHYVVTVWIRLAKGESWLNTSAGHPDRKAAGVVVAPEIIGCQFALTVVGPPKLAAPNDKRIIQHSATLEVAN